MYVDGFNLYYGARALCGRGTPGWRWLDLRGLAAGLVSRPGSWSGAQVERVVPPGSSWAGFFPAERTCPRGIPRAEWRPGARDGPSALPASR